MSRADFDAFVNRQQDEGAGKASFDPQQQLREWREYLRALYGQIGSYLRTYVDSGTAKISLRDIQLNEEFIGPYIASQLILTIGRSTITFTPIGTLLIGAKGRVDVQGPLGTARLILVNKLASNRRELVHMTVRRAGGPPSASSTEQVIEQIEWTWKLTTLPPNTELIDLTQDTFFNMILSVASG